MKIIALSGSKLSGKTTAAKHIRTKWKDSHIIEVASPLKQIVFFFFDDKPRRPGVMLYELDEDKNRVLPCGKTVRQLLQIIGTDYFRKIDSKAHVRALQRQIDRHLTMFHKHSGRIIIPDVRFIDELNYIHNATSESLSIKLLRQPFKDKHSTEKGIPDTSFDYVIDNSNMSIRQQNRRIREILKQEYFL